MVSPVRLHRYTYREYLALEDGANVRHEVVLVAHDEQLVEVWRRGETGTWARSEARSGSIQIDSIGCVLDVADVYRDELAG